MRLTLGAWISRGALLIGDGAAMRETKGLNQHCTLFMLDELLTGWIEYDVGVGEFLCHALKRLD